MPKHPVKHPYVGGLRWAFLRWADIPDARDPQETYLRRLRVVQTPWFAIYVHWIYQADEDRDPHDHPFAFCSLILRGWYRERVWVTPGDINRGIWRTKTWERLTAHRMPRRYAHMIVEASENLVTLIITGRNHGGWGFWTPEGKVPWQEYNKARNG